jgi:Zn finger protein HypA/HybF involved in hydrogenase expression
MAKSVPVQLICRGCNSAFRTRVRGGSTSCPHCGRDRYVRQGQGQEWEGPVGGLVGAASHPALTRAPVECRCSACGRRWESRAASSASVRCPGCRHSCRVPVRASERAPGRPRSSRAAPLSPQRAPQAPRRPAPREWPVLPGPGRPAHLSATGPAPAPSPAPRPAPAASAPILAPPRVPAGSPWSVGPDTGPAVARLGLIMPPLVGQRPGECALWDSLSRRPCDGGAWGRAELGRTAWLPVCRGHARAVVSLVGERGGWVRVRPAREGDLIGLPAAVLGEPL